MDINTFKAAISTGVVRPYRWRVIFNFPSGTETGEGGRQANLLAKTTVLPSATLGKIELPWGGRIVPVPGDREFADIEFSFLAVQNFDVWASFTKWSDYINGFESNVPQDTSYIEQTKDITMELLDAHDNVLQQIILSGAYPLVVGEMTLDRGARDEASEFNVTMAYIEHHITSVTT